MDGHGRRRNAVRRAQCSIMVRLRAACTSITTTRWGSAEVVCARVRAGRVASPADGRASGHTWPHTGLGSVNSSSAGRRSVGSSLGGVRKSAAIGAAKCTPRVSCKLLAPVCVPFCCAVPTGASLCTAARWRGGSSERSSREAFAAESYLWAALLA